jgi:uncharacterized protein YggE
MHITRHYISVALIVAALVLASPARTTLSASAPSNSISVSGEAEVLVVPDEVVLTLGVESFDRVLKTAKTANDNAIARTIAVARGYGIPAEYIQTDYLGIAPVHRNSEIALELLGYDVRKTVVIKLRDISKFEGLLTDSLDAGVTHVHMIDFRTTELRKYRDQARTMALKAAQEKAALLASEAGHTVGAVESIGEASYGYFSSYGSWWGSRYAGQTQNVSQSLGETSLSNDATMAPGQISIRASVHISFALQ